jgi:hypothetical protein
MHECEQDGTDFRRKLVGLMNECDMCGLPTHGSRLHADGAPYSPRFCTRCEPIADRVYAAGGHIPRKP